MSDNKLITIANEHVYDQCTEWKRDHSDLSISVFTILSLNVEKIAKIMYSELTFFIINFLMIYAQESTVGEKFLSMYTFFKDGRNKNQIFFCVWRYIMLVNKNNKHSV